MLDASELGISITDEEFAYLSLQHGAISDLSIDRHAWEVAYQASLAGTYQNIAPHLPARCGRILDIGSGLGGIDVLLSRHYGGHVEIVPIDGAADAPVMNRHAETFNSEEVTRRFLARNGVDRVSYFSPNALPPPTKFKLIISIASWCFHYPPATYLNFVKACLHQHGRLIVDVRDRAEWRRQLGASFSEEACILTGRKSHRMVYAAN